MVEIGDFPGYDPWAPKGWICPRCGRVYAPSTPMCWYCIKETAANSMLNTTATPINWDEYLYKSSITSTDIRQSHE